MMEKKVGSTARLSLRVLVHVVVFDDGRIELPAGGVALAALVELLMAMLADVAACYTRSCALTSR